MPISKTASNKGAKKKDKVEGASEVKVNALKIADSTAEESSVAGARAGESSVAGARAEERSVAVARAEERSVAVARAEERSVAVAGAEERSVAVAGAEESSVADTSFDTFSDEDSGDEGPRSDADISDQKVAGSEQNWIEKPAVPNKPIVMPDTTKFFSNYENMLNCSATEDYCKNPLKLFTRYNVYVYDQLHENCEKNAPISINPSLTYADLSKYLSILCIKAEHIRLTGRREYFFETAIILIKLALDTERIKSLLDYLYRLYKILLKETPSVRSYQISVMENKLTDAKQDLSDIQSLVLSKYQLKIYEQFVSGDMKERFKLIANNVCDKQMINIDEGNWNEKEIEPLLFRRLYLEQESAKCQNYDHSYKECAGCSKIIVGRFDYTANMRCTHLLCNHCIGIRRTGRKHRSCPMCNRMLIYIMHGTKYEKYIDECPGWGPLSKLLQKVQIDSTNKKKQQENLHS